VERDADGRLLVVADSSFLINFLVLGRVDLLGGLPQLRFHVVNHVTLRSNTTSSGRGSRLPWRAAS
jgi:hypothetical protein